MTKIPLSIPDDTANVIPSKTQPTNIADAWIAIVLAALFLIVAVYQTFLCLRHRAFVAWSVILAAILECISLVEYAYHSAYPVSTGWLATGAMVHWIGPTVLLFFCIQVFARAAWEAAAVSSNRRHLPPLLGFIRLNTIVFGASSFAAWIVLCVGSAVIVAVAPNGQVTHSNTAAVTAGHGTLKAGLVLQLIILLACSLIVWRFRVLTRFWDVEWDEKRRFIWTWKKLMTLVLSSLGLLLVRQTYHLVRFFLNYTEQPWLGLVFDAIPILAIMVIFTVCHPGRCLSVELAGFRVKKTCHQSSSGLPVIIEEKMSG